MRAAGDIRRAGASYGASAVRAMAVAGQVEIVEPKAGFYRGRLRSKSIAGGIRIWFGPPHDPVTGEVMDRGWRWQAEFDGQFVEFDDVWPVCAGDPITEREYGAYVKRRQWAAQNTPNSAFAKPGRRYDPLDSSNALPF